MVAAMLCFASMDTLSKYIVHTYGIAEVLFVRSVIYMALAVVVARQDGGSFLRAMRTRRPWLQFGRSALAVAENATVILAFSFLPLADAHSVGASSPLIVVALSAPLLGEKVGAFRWSVVLVGFCGVLIIVQPGSGMLQIGALVAIGAAFTGAVTAVTIRQLNKFDSSVAIVFYFTLFSTVMTAAPLPWVWQTPSATEWAMAITAGLMGGIGQYLMTQAYALAPAAVVGPFNYAGLLWAAGFGWLVWGDVPSWHVVTGAAIVMASGLTLLYRETHRQKRHG